MAKLANPKIKQMVSFDQAITMTGMGKFNLFVLLASGLCLMCVIIQTMCMMFIIPAAQCDLKLRLSEKGLLSSSLFFGVAASSHMWGFLADTRGRKHILTCSLFASSLVSLLTCIIPWSWLMILLSFVNGFCLGGGSAVVYAYAGEFFNDKNRPKVVSWIATFVALGNMYLPGFAWIILPQTWTFDLPLLGIFFRPWRLLIIVYAIPSLVAAISLYCLPESPKYLLTQGKYEETLKVLKYIFKMNTGKQDDEYLVSGILWDELSDPNELKKSKCFLTSMWKQTTPLFKRPLILKTLMVSMLQFGIFLSSSGVVMWYPEILNEMSQYSNEVSDSDVSLCNSIMYDEDMGHHNASVNEKPVYICKDTVNTEVFLISLFIGMAYAVTYLFIGSVINIFGKKNLLAGCLAVTGCAGLAAQLIHGYTYLQVLIGVFVMGGSGIGIVNAVVVDLYPTQIRAMALSITLMLGRFGAMVGTNIVGPLLYKYCDYTFYVFAAEHLVLVIIVLLLPSSGLPKLIEPIT